MGKFIALIVVVAAIMFFMFERGEKPLSFDQVEQRLAGAGFEIDLQDEVLLYSEQEDLLPEEPETIETIRLRHPDIGSDTVTLASFSNEKVSHWLKGKTNGFPSRNWFFFGIINTAMTREVQAALEVREGEMEFRIRTSDAELTPIALVEEETDIDEVSPEEVLTRREVLDRFEAAGLTINRIEEDREMPRSVAKKLTSEPLDDFVLFIEEEGVFPIEFETVEEAVAMQREHKKGFRHGNWYFPGQITSSLRDSLVSALKN
jgi:hypothetical protein